MNGHLAIHALLARSATLAALVGPRIYPDIMPDNPVYPAVTFQKLSGKSERGAVVDPALMQAVFQVSSWGRSRMEAASVASAVRAALDRVRKITLTGVVIDDVFYENDVDLFDNDTRTYFNHCSFKIYYRDA